MSNKTVKGFASILLVFFVSFLTFKSGILKSIDNIFTDQVYQSVRTINNDIKIIAIDEKTLEKLGPFGGFSRQIYADLNRILMTKDSKPAVIGYDILLFGNMDQTGDEDFVNSVKEHGSVCVASHVLFGEKLIQKDSKVFLDKMHVLSLELPYEALNQVAKTGFADTAPERDSMIRNTLLYVNDEETKLQSFATVCYEMYQASKGLSPVYPPTDENGRFWISFAGYPGDYEVISLVDVLQKNVDPLLFEDALVLVGAYAPGMQDAYNVPIQKNSQMYGVEIHANIIQALIDQKYALPVNNTLSAALFAAITALLWFLFLRLKKVYVSVFLLIFVILGTIVLGFFLYEKGWMINLIYLPLSASICFFTSLVFHYILESRNRKKVVYAFKKYVAPQVVDEIIKEGNYKIKLGGENRHIAVMFVDIRGFTPMSERLNPEEVVEILNSYLELTTQAIFKNGGTLDKFIGDATMAIFNAPFDLENYLEKAAQTALDIVEGSKTLEKNLKERFGETIGMGIGLNCGEAVVGNIGCLNRMDYTAIGDTVNTASRLESKAKSSQILMSEVFYLALQEKIEAKLIGEMELKGKLKTVNVYELEKIKENEKIINYT